MFLVCPAISRIPKMFFSVKEMELRKIRFDEAFPPGRIDFAGEDLEQLSALNVAGSAELVEHSGGEVRIQGRYSVQMSSPCDRCLKRAHFPLEARFDLYYRPMSSIARDEEVEVDDSEVEVAFYEGGGIELGDVVKEQVLLALPMQRVCSANCKGICPVCGRNRNETDCDCHVESHGDDRWGALRKLELH
jgi:uncharacterized protein